MHGIDIPSQVECPALNAGHNQQGNPILGYLCRALQRMLAGMRVSALVTDATDYTSVGPLAREYGIPLMLIVATVL
jgi:hypothetical protein